MTSTSVAWPSADVAHGGQLDQPLPVDGSAYTEPSVLAVDTAGYQGGDSDADGSVTAALALPEVELGTASSSGISMVAKSEHSYATFSQTEVSGTSITLPIPTVGVNGASFTLAEDDLVVVQVWSHSAVTGDPGAPSSCTHSSLSFSSMYSLFASIDFRPRPSAYYSLASGDETGDVTVSWGSSNRYTGTLTVYRGVHASNPFGGVTPVASYGFDYPNPPPVTVAHQGSMVVVHTMGNAASSGYPIPKAPPGYTEVLNTAKTKPNTRRPAVHCVLADCSPGSYDPGAFTVLDWANTAAVSFVLRPAEAVEVPIAVVVASTDETASTALSSGDVALTATNEIQRLRSFLVGSGTRTLTFSGQTTGSISYNASAATVQSALEALSNIAVGDVICSGGPLDVNSILIEFTNSYALTDVPLITVSSTNSAPVDEVQAIQSDRTGGTFTLTFGGQVTAPLPYNASASAIETALAALSTIGANNVSCTGGPLPGASVLVEFTGDEGGQAQSILTDTDSGTGGTAGVTITELTDGAAGSGMVVDSLTVGSPGEALTLVDSINVPRDGAYQPQVHVFLLTASPYVAGSTIDITVSSHDGNHSWAAALLVLDPATVDLAGVIEALGGESKASSGTTATFASITPVTPGAKVLALTAKALAGSRYSGVGQGVDGPAGYSPVAQAVADAMTLDVHESPPVAAAATRPGSASWSGTEAWTTSSLALAPLVGSSAGTGLWSVLNSPSTSTWVDIAPAAGSMFQVLEVDLGSVPADAVITGAKIEVAHAASVPNQIRVALVGIADNGDIVLAPEQQAGYPAGAGTTILETAYWTELSDGSPLANFDRLGIALISSSRHPALSNHRIFWARATIRYETGGPVVFDVAGPVDPGDSISWNYASAGGYPQAFYEVMILQGTGIDPAEGAVPDDPLAPLTGDIIYGSGPVPGNLVRSLALPSSPLGRGPCTVAVRAWAQVSGSLLVASDWASDNFDLGGTPATTPDQSGGVVAYRPTDGGVSVTVDAPAGVRRAWLEHSIGLIGLPSVQSVSFRVQQALATPGTPDHVLTALGRTSQALISRAQLDGVLDDWLNSTNGTLYEVESATEFHAAVALSEGGDLIRCTADFTGDLNVQGNRWDIPGANLSASPAGGLPGLPLIVTCADGVMISGTSQASNEPVLDLINCEHVWAVGFNVSGGQFGIRGINWGGSEDHVAYAAYCDVSHCGHNGMQFQGRFESIEDGGGTAPEGGEGNSWGYSSWFVAESNIVDSVGETADEFGEGIYLGRGASPGWVSRALWCWVRGNAVSRFSSDGVDVKPGCVGFSVTDNVFFMGTAVSGAPIGLCYVAAGIDGRPSWFIGVSPDGYVEGNRVYDVDTTVTNASSAHYMCVIGLAGMTIANNIVWAHPQTGAHPTFRARNEKGTDDATAAVEFGTHPTVIVNNTCWSDDSFDNAGYGLPGIAAFPGTVPFVLRNNVVNESSPSTGEVYATAADFIAAVPAIGVAGTAEWEDHGPGSAFDLDPDSDLQRAGESIADIDLLIDADICGRPIPSEDPNPGAFQPFEAGDGSQWTLSPGGPWEVEPSADNTLVDWWAPGNEEVSYRVSFDDGPMTETSTPATVGTGPVWTTPAGWYFIIPSRPELSMSVNVAEYDSVQPHSSVVANQPGGALVAISRPLGKTMSFTVRTRDKAERDALEALLDSLATIRVVNILGESWLMRLASDRQRSLQRWKPLPAERTALRDSYRHSFTLVEVSR